MQPRREGGHCLAGLLRRVPAASLATKKSIQTDFHSWSERLWSRRIVDFLKLPHCGIKAVVSGDGVSPWGNWASFWLACQASQPGCPVKHQGAALNCLVALSAYSILQHIDSACPCQKTRGFWVGGCLEPCRSLWLVGLNCNHMEIAWSSRSQGANRRSILSNSFFSCFFDNIQWVTMSM